MSPFRKHGSSRSRNWILLFLLLCFALVLPTGSYLKRILLRSVLADTGTGSVSLVALGTAATENFDTLSNTAGSTTNTALPTGWYITEGGGGARDNEQYAVDTGGSTTGDIYSYGAAGSTERALGQLRSGTLIPLFGAKFTNNTGATITSLDVSYTGEQWRFGGVHSTVADRLDFVQRQCDGLIYGDVLGCKRPRLQSARDSGHCRCARRQRRRQPHGHLFDYHWP